MLNSSRYCASASALVDAKVLEEIDTVKSNRSDPRKWPGTAQEMLGRALGRAMAHEARHLYIVGHADTGLGSDSPQFVEGMDSDFSSQDRRDILDAIRRLESTQGNATVVETFPRDRRAVGIPF